MDIIEIVSGSTFRLYGIVEKDKCKVTEFIDDLPMEDQEQVIATMNLIIQRGDPFNKEKFKHIGNDIYEIKTRRGIRILCFKGNNNSLILIEGFRKPQKKVLSRKKKIAEKCKEIYFSGDEEINIIEHEDT